MPPAQFATETPACCFNGHAFQPRYSTVPPSEAIYKAAASTDNEYWDVDEINSVIESLTAKTYECDVCVRCGLTAGVVGVEVAPEVSE